MQMAKAGKSRDPRHEFYVIIYIFLLLLILLMGYMVHYVAFEASAAINSSYNTRQQNLEKLVIRGTIFAANGEILAEQAMNESHNEVRYYPYKELFAHAVGFSTHGKSGVEKAANISLLTSNAPVEERLKKELSGLRNYGDNIYTSFDVGLQKAASDALGIYRGAAVVLEAKTGRVLAMVSKPDFDPNTVSQNWTAISAQTDKSPLLNRATQGLYPPGSTFKMLTLLEYMREHPSSYSEFQYKCNGSFTEDDVTVECYHGSIHGNVDLKAAFEKSCNSAFAYMGSSLDLNTFKETSEELLFNKELPLDLSYNMSKFPITPDAGTEEILHTAIGQGNILATPMHIAMITAAIANDGILMCPYEIDKKTNYLGALLESYSPREYGRVMTQEEAAVEREYMSDVVINGTGRGLINDKYTVAGKTGSAEYGTIKGQSHAWFTGFSPAEKPEVVVTVLMEGAGSGSDYAVPVAKQILDAYYMDR